MVAPKVGHQPKQPRVKPTLLAPGAIVDHYEIIRSLGAGGMGQVFLARDVKLGRLVAMKVLFPTSHEVATRMLVEARATAKCTHENIVVIHDMNEHEGMPYLVLEYMDGTSLRKYEGEERLPLIRIVEVMVSVTRALEHAHAAGIIHRDLKPDNVFLTSNGVVKVLDFGIAKLHGAPAIEGGYPGETRAIADNETYITISGDGPIGTRMYMSPEQWASADVDGRTDVWAAGVMLFRLITGEYPYMDLEYAPLMFAVMSPNEPVRSIRTVAPGLHGGLADIVDRCLRKNRAERFTAGELRAALEALLPSRASNTDGRCPYPGLEAFQESDSERFFGRAEQVARVRGRLQSEPFLAIVGPSGVGKSSFVRAGLVPTLKAEARWESIVLRPGRQPLVSLASAISPNVDRDYLRAVAARMYEEPGFLGAMLRKAANESEQKVLLFIDQFEELYTLCPDVRLRRAFVASLRAAADDPSSPIRVIISLRSDFLDRPAEDPAFMATLTNGIHYLMPLGREGLWHALVRPAEQVNHVFESGELVERMLDEMASSSNALPLLQFAAARMWEFRDRARAVLTAESYNAMGGIAGALAVHADAVLAELSYERRRLAQLVFQRLVTAEGTRAIVDLDELVTLSPDANAIRGLVDTLVTARLLVSKSDDQGVGATVEIVHESLIVAWPQLRQWAEAGREEATFLTSLRHAAQQWESRGCPAGLLWRGEAADEARRFAVRLGPTLGPRERRYLDAVIALATRSSRLRRFAVATTMIILGGLVIVASIVVVKVRTAEHEALKQADEARAARSQLQDQLQVIQDKETARLAAEKQAAEAAKTAADAGEAAQMSREALQKSNAQLAKALAAARTASEQEKAMRMKVEGLLEEEKKRNKNLAKQRDKMAKDLR